MAETIIITAEEREQTVIPERESVVIADSETRSVSLNMADGDQVITPHPGKVLSQVTVRKPALMRPSHIKKDVTIGGVVGTYQGEKLPELDDQASSGDVLAGKDYVYRLGDYLSVKRGGTLETYDGIVNLSMADGDQVVTAASGKLLSSVTVNKPVLMVPQNIKKGIPIGGVVGTYDPHEFDNDFVNIYWQEVTVDTTETSTGAGVRDYLYGKLGLTVSNRLIGFGLRKRTTYTDNEIVRYVIYPNANHCTIAKYSNGSFVSGSLSGAAPLISGRVYDVYYWLGHNPDEEPTR